jgi:hypothetical protein
MVEKSYQSLDVIKFLGFEPLIRKNQSHHVFSGSSNVTNQKTAPLVA